MKIKAFLRATGILPAASPSLEPSTPVPIAGSGPDAPFTETELAKIAEINQAIDEFADVMRQKMTANIRKKDGWRSMDIEHMWRLAMLEIEELRLAMDYEPAGNVQRECADVGNFMMMLFHRVPSDGSRRDRRFAAELEKRHV